jgi:hypothetical protein
MLKALPFVLLALIPACLQGQLEAPAVKYPVLPKEGKAPTDFVPGGWTVEKQGTADLNADGLPDVMMVLHMNDRKNVLANPDHLGADEVDTNPRMLVIALQDQRQQYHLQVADHALIPRHVNPVLDDPLEDATVANGALKVSLVFWASAGSWSSSRVSYTLRFEAGCLRLIGYDSEESKRNTGEVSALSINYLTGKVKVSKGTFEDDALKDQWRPLKGQRKLCLEEIGDGLEFTPEQ